MSAFKSLTSQDVIITPFVVNKSFSFEGSASFNEVGIQQFIGVDTEYSSSIDITFTSFYNNNSQSAALVYNSIKQLYYTNYIPNPISSSYIVTDLNGNIVESDLTTNIYSRFDNFLQTTLSQSRYFPSSSSNPIFVLSIPFTLFGDYINPNSFNLEAGGVSYTDNGEGEIININNDVVGIITYPHGLIVFTDSDAGTFFNSNITCSFQSARTIYETQYKCTIRENEFNYSLNPSLISSSGNFTNPLNSSCSIDISGQVYDFVTGSSWAPYISAVGLYNDNNELLAVAKLSQPLPTSRTTDMSLLINMDK
jgi:hypothetical protein